MSKIKVKDYLHINMELTAAGTITPGMLIKQTTATACNVHASSQGDAFPMFALEDQLQGRGITDNYSSGERVQCWIPTRGDEVYAILKDGKSVSIGTFVASNGDGKLAQVVPEDLAAVSGNAYSAKIIGIALEAASPSGDDARIKIRII